MGTIATDDQEPEIQIQIAPGVRVPVKFRFTLGTWRWSALGRTGLVGGTGDTLETHLRRAVPWQ